MRFDFETDLKKMQIDEVAEKYKDAPFLTYKIFKDNFRDIYKVWDKNIETILILMYIKFVRRNSPTGLGLLDPSSKYGNIYYDYVQKHCGGYINSPHRFQLMDLSILQDSYNRDQTSGLNEVLFNNYATKNFKYKYFDSFGTGNNYAKFNKNLDLMQETLNLLIQQNIRNKHYTKKYYIVFHSNLDLAGLKEIFGLEFMDLLSQCVLIVNVQNTKQINLDVNDITLTENNLTKFLITYRDMFNIVYSNYEVA